MRPADLGAVENAFWLVLAMALLMGGGRAVSGLPGLFGVFLPSGFMAAQADVQGPAARIHLPVRLPQNSSTSDAGTFGPQVLTPVPSRRFPDWLNQRVKYARLASGVIAAVPAADRAPAIAIVIDDLGPDVDGTRRAIALPKNVTLSFLPYGDDTRTLVRMAERVGHQVIAHVPMEPEGSEDPGPMALRTDLPASINRARLDWALSRVPGHAGINNHMGSRFTRDRAALIPVMAHLAGRIGFFLDSRTTPHSQVIPLARAFGIATAGRDVFLDDAQRGSYVERQLAATERVAREQGVAIAIGHPHDVTLSALRAWTAQITARGYRLVPLSTAIHMKIEQAAMRVAIAQR